MTIKLKKSEKFLLVFVTLLVAAFLYLTYLNKYKRGQATTTDKYPLAQVNIKDSIKKNVSLTDGKTGTVLANQSLSVLNEHTVLPIYKYEPFKFDDYYVSQVTNALGLKNTKKIDTDLGTTIMASRNQLYLTINLDRKFIEYDNLVNFSQTEHFQTGSYLKPDKEKIQNFLNPFMIDIKDYSLAETKFYFSVKNGEISEVNLPQKGNLVRYKFVKTVDGIQLVDKKDSLYTNSIKIWMSPEGKVTKAYINPVGSVNEPIGKFPLLSKKQIISKINSGEGKLINTIGLPLSEITVTRVGSAELVYYAVNGYAVPTYRLKGISTSRDFKQIESYIFLEAIDKDRIK